MIAAIEACKTLQCRAQEISKIVTNLLFDMDRFDFEPGLRAVCLAIDAPDQAVAVQQWQAEIAKLPQRLGHITFNLVVVVEHFATALALDEQVVKGRQDAYLCDAARGAGFEQFGVDVDTAVVSQRLLG